MPLARVLLLACIFAGTEAFSSSFAPSLARLGVKRSICVGAVATAKDGDGGGKLLGSRRLRSIKDVLSKNPDQLDQSNKVLGSRRIGEIVGPAKGKGAKDAAPSPQTKKVEAAEPKQEEKEEKEQVVVEQTAAVAGAGESTAEVVAPAIKEDPPIAAPAPVAPSMAEVAAPAIKVDPPIAAPAPVAPTIKVDMSALPDSVEKDIEMDATPEECYRVAADLAGYKDWAGGVEKVTVLETGADGLASQAEFSVGAFGQTLDYVLAYEHDLPRRVAWTAISGSVKALVGSYTFSDLGNGRTKVNYKLAIDPGFNVPRMIKTPATKLIVGTALNELRKQVEKPATKAAFLASKKI